jgi:HEAT repeat protein
VLLAAFLAFLVVAAMVARPSRALLAVSVWVVLTLVLLASTGLIFPQCWTAVLGGVGLAWLTRLLWDQADRGRVVKLATAAGLPAERLLVHLAAQPAINDNAAFARSDSPARLRSTHELVWQLGHSDDDQRLQAVEQLAGRDDADATRALVSCLADSSTAVRVTARAALVGMGGAAVAPLCEALEYEDEQVAWTAAELLGEVGDERAVEPLQWASRDRREAVRQSARRSLAALGRPVAEYAAAEA